MLRVKLIRHGQSHSNAGLVTVDTRSNPLTDRGYQEAARVAQQFEQAPELIVTSPYLRTQQTAAATRDRFPEVPHQEWQVQEFTYLSSELANHTSRAERLHLAEAYWERCDPAYRTGKDAESFADLIDRIRQMDRQIAALEQHDVAIFTHGTFTRTALWWWLTRPAAITAVGMRQCRHFMNGVVFMNCGIVPVQFDQGDRLIGGISVSHLVA